MTGEVIQWNVLNVSGTAPLYVKEKYYALELVSCDEEVYIEEVCYEYNIQNTGNNDMTVTTVTYQIDESPAVELADLVLPNPLAPGQSSLIEQKINVDYCTTQTVINKVTAEGLNPDGDVCEDTDESRIPIAPQCIIDSNITCTEKDTGLDCEDIPPIESGVCDCSPGCATEVRFVYHRTPVCRLGTQPDRCETCGDCRK